MLADPKGGTAVILPGARIVGGGLPGIVARVIMCIPVGSCPPDDDPGSTLEEGGQRLAGMPYGQAEGFSNPAD